MKIQLTILAAVAAASISLPALADCVTVETGPAAVKTSATAHHHRANVSSTADANASKNTAVILRPVALRDRPVANATGDVIASADTSVRLEHGIKNSDGNWWFVTAPGLGGGWVQTSELANLPQM
jgi:hypothetical protein